MAILWEFQSRLNEVTGCGLKLYAVVVMVWRTPDTKKNHAQFAPTANKAMGHEARFPQVCMMELSSHFILNYAFDSVNENAMNRAAKLVSKQVPYNSLILSERRLFPWLIVRLATKQYRNQERNVLIYLK
jgi:hypothetical protein